MRQQACQNRQNDVFLGGNEILMFKAIAHSTVRWPFFILFDKVYSPDSYRH